MYGPEECCEPMIIIKLGSLKKFSKISYFFYFNINLGGWPGNYYTDQKSKHYLNSITFTLYYIVKFQWNWSYTQGGEYSCVVRRPLTF